MSGPGSQSTIDESGKTYPQPLATGQRQTHADTGLPSHLRRDKAKQPGPLSHAATPKAGPVASEAPSQQPKASAAALSGTLATAMAGARPRGSKVKPLQQHGPAKQASEAIAPSVNPILRAVRAAEHDRVPPSQRGPSEGDAGVPAEPPEGFFKSRSAVQSTAVLQEEHAAQPQAFPDVRDEQGQGASQPQGPSEAQDEQGQQGAAPAEGESPESAVAEPWREAPSVHRHVLVPAPGPDLDLEAMEKLVHQAESVVEKAPVGAALRSDVLELLQEPKRLVLWDHIL
eukprot:jgi/Botrbrau1/3433/Bobra.139_1s0013.1